MYVVVASVPGSGTRFVVEHLLASFTRCREGVAECGYFAQHADPRYLSRLCDLARRHPCIVPLRHPEKVAESWLKRIGRPRPPGWDGMLVMAEYFRRLIENIDPLGPLYLPLDVPNRQDYLDSINADLGLNLTTEWPMWGHDDQVVELTSEDHYCLGRMMNELSEFFGRFGYKT